MRFSCVIAKVRRKLIFRLLILNLIFSFWLQPQVIIADSEVVQDIIIDTDLGPDDVGAILFLLSNSKTNVKAITISPGLTYIDKGVENALHLLDVLEYSGIPVAGGQDLPMKGDNSFPSQWRDGSNNFFGIGLPTVLNPSQPSELNASELIVSITKNSSIPITIVTLGPMTNIALAINLDPSIINNINNIHAMGGAVLVDGNVGFESNIPNFEAEWNFYVDPYALDIVFNSGIPVTIIPLDATNKVPQTEEFKQNLNRVKETEEANIFYQTLTPGLYFWDQLAAAALVDNSIVTIQEFNLIVVTSEINHEGELREDSNEGVNIAAAVDVDKDLFASLFVRTINNDIYWTDDSSGMTNTSKTAAISDNSENGFVKFNSMTYSLLSIAILIVIRLNRKQTSQKLISK